jgi:hypothetical protein
VHQENIHQILRTCLEKERVSSCVFPLENEFVNEPFFLDLGSFSAFRLVQTRTSSYEFKKVGGGSPDVDRVFGTVRDVQPQQYQRKNVSSRCPHC